MAKQTQAGNKQVEVVKNPTVGSGRGKQSATGRMIPVCTIEERHRMICEEAYSLAEQRGFQGDTVLEDWLQAEAKVDAANILKAVVEDRDDAI